MIKDIPDDAYIVRATELGQFMNCPRNWFFMSHNGLNLEPRVRPQKLRFGLVWHKGMEYLYSNKDPFEGMAEEFKKEEELIYGVAAYDAEIAQAIEEEKDLARMMMEGYMAWRNTASPPDSSFTTKAVERRIVVEIPGGTGALLAIRFDGEVLKSGGLWVLEHKTRGKSSSVDNPPELALDLQMGLQLYGASKTNTEPVRGAIYNLARKMKPSARVKSPLFGRHEVVRTKHELAVIELVVASRVPAMQHYTALAKAYTDTGESSILEIVPYNPQPLGLCSWGCSVKNICESINRREDVKYLISTSLKLREKNILEVLAEELPNED